MSFQGIFHNFWNYGPDTCSICGIMALKSTRIHGIMGTEFLGKMARPGHIIGRVTPPPPKNESLCLVLKPLRHKQKCVPYAVFDVSYIACSIISIFVLIRERLPIPAQRDS